MANPMGNTYMDIHVFFMTKIKNQQDERLRQSETIRTRCPKNKFKGPKGAFEIDNTASAVCNSKVIDLKKCYAGLLFYDFYLRCLTGG